MRRSAVRAIRWCLSHCQFHPLLAASAVSTPSTLLPSLRQCCPLLSTASTAHTSCANHASAPLLPTCNTPPPPPLHPLFIAVFVSMFSGSSSPAGPTSTSAGPQSRCFQPPSASQKTFSYSQFPLPARFVSKSSSPSPRALVAATATNCQCQHRVCLVLQLVSSATLGATHSPTLSTQSCCISIINQQVSCLCVKCLSVWRCCTRASSHRSSPLAEPSIPELIPFLGERDGVIVWIDFFCDSQHARLPSWPPPAVIKDSKWFMNNFAELIATIGWVLMVMQPWDAPMTLKRSWCVLELGHCSRTNCRCFSTINSSSVH